MKLKRSETYVKWLYGLRDRHAQLRIKARTLRLMEGNAGDHKDFGDISELRIDYGPGYRIYYTRRGQEIILLLAGGDKRTQARDIENARRIAKEWDGEDHD
ncbi:MAG: type II toxin-antitoxin system RelE/ParE family toxin [Actinomycetia bacterium]|nr:type II toxin-antitoxin system RelE/ParE family toxin [Actinomycetes bacterium]